MSGALLAALVILTCIPLYYGDTSLQEMAEDTYRRFVPCLKEFGLEQSAIDRLKFPNDAEAHYQELLRATEKYRTGIPTHSYGGFAGPWIENHFIQKYKDKPLSHFRGLIPIFVQWVDIHVVSLNATLKADSSSLKISQQTHGQIPQILQRLLRPNVLYVISQPSIFSPFLDFFSIPLFSLSHYIHETHESNQTSILITLQVRHHHTR
jgi:hypothetical protein